LSFSVSVLRNYSNKLRAYQRLLKILNLLIPKADSRLKLLSSRINSLKMVNFPYLLIKRENSKNSSMIIQRGGVKKSISLKNNGKMNLKKRYPKLPQRKQERQK
jgi:hypothetical protein